MAWDVGYLNHLCFHPHLIKPTKAERTLREKLSWTTWCSDSAVLTRRWRHANFPSPPWDLTRIWTRMTCPSPILDDDVPAAQCSTRTWGRLNARSRAGWRSCSSRCSSANSPGGCGAAISAGSNPSGRSLWPTLPRSGSSWTAQAIPASPREY